MVATAGNKYCVGDVLMSGDLWVSRDRLRLAKPRPSTIDSEGVGDADLSMTSQSEASPGSHGRRSFVERTLSFSGLSSGLSSPRSSRSGNYSERKSCAIM